MKVGFFSFHTFSRPGGVKTHILGLKKEFEKRKIETKILAPRRHFFEKYKDVILLGTSFKINFGGGETDFDIVFTPFSIERVLKRENFDILHFHNFGFPAILQVLNSPLAKKPLKIMTFHSNLERSKILKEWPFFVSLLNKVLNWRIDGLILVSPYLLKFFEEYKGPKKVIPNGVDIEKFEKAKKIKKFLDSKINILYVGRIEERKGLIYLLRAFKILQKKFKNLRLIVVGDGEKEKECKDFVKKEKLKNVIFEGAVSQEKIPSYYKSCHIFCAPSIYGESFGIVLLEAMAAKKPIVAFNIPGFNEVIKGKGQIFLAKPKDIEDLSKKLQILIENKNLRKEMGQWGFKEVQKYSWEKIAEKVLNFYKSCLKTRAS